MPPGRTMPLRTPHCGQFRKSWVWRRTRRWTPEMTCNTRTWRAASTPSYRGNLRQRRAADRFDFFSGCNICSFHYYLSINAVSWLVALAYTPFNIDYVLNKYLRHSQTIKLNSLSVAPVKCCLFWLFVAVSAVADVVWSYICHGSLNVHSSSLCFCVLNTSYNDMYITTAVSKSPVPLNRPCCNYRVHTLLRVTGNCFLKSKVGANGRFKHCMTKAWHIVPGGRRNKDVGIGRHRLYALRQGAHNYVSHLE